MATETTESSGGSSTVKVTVIVAVYNPGDNIEALIASLAGQSLPAAQLEVIFVDDGSTDDTPDRLRRAASEHLNMRVTTIPNSGWPGRPRNVGTDQARGEYVFYCDHDDEFFPEALERMYDLGAANQADIVFGKVVRVGRPTPYWPLALRSIGHADPVGDQLAISRTVHKLFRREFVVEHGLRFPEGKVRLEDHNFMGQALPRARAVSVLADYPCYRWIQRSDGSNNSSGTVSQAIYWGYFSEALDVFAAAAGEGPLLDSARVIATGQAFSRFGPAGYLARSEPRQLATVAAVGDLFRAQAPPVLDARLGVMRRVRVQALRANDKALFDGLQATRLKLDFDVAADEAGWREGVLHVVATATLRSHEALTVRPAGATGIAGVTGVEQSWQLSLGPEVDRRLDELSGPTARLLREDDLGHLELTVRHRESCVEWPLPCTLTRCDTTTAAGDLVPAVRVEARIDPSSGVFGQRLDDGIWDVLARAEFLGEGNAAPVRFAGRQPGGPTRLELRSARAYVTTGGRLALKLTPTPTGGALGKGVRVAGAAWQGEELTLTVSGTPSAGATVLLRPRAGGAPGVAMPAGPVEGGRVRLDPRAIGTGWHDAYLRIETATGVLDERLQLGAVTIAQHPPYAVAASGRALSIRRLDAEEAPPAALVVRPVKQRAGVATQLDGVGGRLVALLPARARRRARGLAGRIRRRLASRS